MASKEGILGWLSGSREARTKAAAALTELQERLGLVGGMHSHTGTYRKAEVQRLVGLAREKHAAAVADQERVIAHAKQLLAEMRRDAARPNDTAAALLEEQTRNRVLGTLRARLAANAFRGGEIEALLAEGQATGDRGTIAAVAEALPE